MSLSEQNGAAALEQAGNWYSRRRLGDMRAEEHRAFETWLARDPGHRVAYAQVDRAWHASGRLRDHPQILAYREDAQRLYRPPQRWRAAAACAAAAVIAVAGWTGWTIRSGPAFARLDRSTFSTAVGQRSTVMLPDGSRLTLDTDSTVLAAETGTERRIDLLRGRAFFDVAKEPGRPFVVYAGQDSVTATGTAFDVRLRPTGTEVTLVRGHVVVERPPGEGATRQVADLSPGQRLIASESRIWRLTPVRPDEATRWVRGQIAFDNQPLSKVVEELNRYSRRKLRLADESVGKTPIVGVFDTSDLDGSVALIADERIARVASQDNHGITLAAVDEK